MTSVSKGPRRWAASVAAVLVLGLAAGCSAGSTPTVPNVVASSSSSAAPTTSIAPRPGCSNANATRVQSFAPGGTIDQLADGSSVREISKRKLRAAVSADNYLFGYRNPTTGKLEGFDIDMVRTVARSIFALPKADDATIDTHIEYRVVNFSQRIPALSAKQVDMVADIMTINCVRWNQIAFSAEYFAASQQLLVRRGSGLTIEKASGRRVCTATGSTGSENLKQNHPQVVAVTVPDISDCIVLFQQGKVDGVISDNTVVAGFAKQDPYAEVVQTPLSSEPYGLGFNQSDTDLVKYVNALLEQMRTDGTWTTLYARWVASTIQNGTQPLPVYGR